MIVKNNDTSALQMKWVDNKWKFVKSEAITPDPISPKETSESLTKSAKKRKLEQEKMSSKERIKQKKNKIISQYASKKFNSVRNLYSNMKKMEKKDASKSISPRLPLSTMLMNKSISPRLPPSTNKKKGTNKVAFDIPKTKNSARSKKKSTVKSQKINIKVVTPDIEELCSSDEDLISLPEESDGQAEPSTPEKNVNKSKTIKVDVDDEDASGDSAANNSMNFLRPTTADFMTSDKKEEEEATP